MRSKTTDQVSAEMTELFGLVSAGSARRSEEESFL
jgi:hypothetical protein